MFKYIPKIYLHFNCRILPVQIIHRSSLGFQTSFKIHFNLKTLPKINSWHILPLRTKHRWLGWCPTWRSTHQSHRYHWCSPHSENQRNSVDWLHQSLQDNLHKYHWKQDAYQVLKALQMKESDLDSYTTTFQNLTAKAGYTVMTQTLLHHSELYVVCSITSNPLLSFMTASQTLATHSFLFISLLSFPPSEFSSPIPEPWSVLCFILILLYKTPYPVF